MCDFSNKLIAWRDGELPDDEAAAIEQHVRVCSECHNRLDAYQKVSGMVDTYCDALLASKARASAKPTWTPVLGTAASIAVLLMLFAHGRAERTPRGKPAVAVPAAPSVVEVASGTEAAPTPVSRQVRSHSIVANARAQEAHRDANWQPSEPAIQIAIPGEAIFPPGALPPGVDFIADVSIAADGSAQRLRLQPRLIGFEGGSNQ
jgi:anti-sigma factor RsiW